LRTPSPRGNNLLSLLRDGDESGSDLNPRPVPEVKDLAPLTDPFLSLDLEDEGSELPLNDRGDSPRAA
jgi:hypothetical protein